MKKHSFLLSILVVAGCASKPVAQVPPPPPMFHAPMTATQLRAPATSDGVAVPAHKAQGLVSGLEALPVAPLVAQEGFWIVANETPAQPAAIATPDAPKKSVAKKVAHKAPKKPVKYVCKPVKGTS
jgi:hypothetical protein